MLGMGRSPKATLSYTASIDLSSAIARTSALRSFRVSAVAVGRHCRSRAIELMQPRKRTRVARDSLMPAADAEEKRALLPASSVIHALRIEAVTASIGYNFSLSWCKCASRDTNMHEHVANCQAME